MQIHSQSSHPSTPSYQKHLLCHRSRVLTSRSLSPTRTPARAAGPSSDTREIKMPWKQNHLLYVEPIPYPFGVQRPLSPLRSKERGQSLASLKPRMRGHGNHIILLRSWEKGTETSLQSYPEVTRGTETPLQGCPQVIHKTRE